MVSSNGGCWRAAQARPCLWDSRSRALHHDRTSRRRLINDGRRGAGAADERGGEANDVRQAAGWGDEGTTAWTSGHWSHHMIQIR
ncbi:hypothetical protein BS78_06G019900 [Paspalum vaginatum]|nr:hypothetical protein BS78_06G019900 [Paspalum vaginatum]